MRYDESMRKGEGSVYIAKTCDPSANARILLGVSFGNSALAARMHPFLKEKFYNRSECVFLVKESNIN